MPEGLFLGFATIPPPPFGGTSLCTREAMLDMHGFGSSWAPTPTGGVQNLYAPRMHRLFRVEPCAIYTGLLLTGELLPNGD